jgi:hypothetical protein
VHIAPIGAKQESPLGFADRSEIAQAAIAGAVENASRVGLELARQELQTVCPFP